MSKKADNPKPDAGVKPARRSSPAKQAPALDQIVTAQMQELARETQYNFARRAPAVFLPYQQRWAADGAKVKVMEKSRRVGLSWAEAADAVSCAAGADGMDVWYIGYNKDMAIEFILDCAQWAAHLQSFAEAIEIGEEVFKDGDQTKAVMTFGIRFDSGLRITALSSRPSNLRGKQGRVIIDEAAFHEDLKALTKAAMALLIWGGQVRYISTDNGTDSDFNELLTDVRAKKLPYSLHRITFDEALAQGLYKRICMKLGTEWSATAQATWRLEIRALYGSDAEEELDCIPKNSAGAWLSRNLIEARMIDAPVLRYEAPKGFEIWPDRQRHDECQAWIDVNLAPLLKALDRNLQSGFGEDFGRSGDLTVIAPWQIQKNLRRRFPFLVELRNMPFRQQEQILFYIADGLPRFISAAMDARGNGQFLAEVAAQRYSPQRVEQVMLSDPWYREHTAPMKAAFEDGMIEIPRDKDVLDDLRAFQVIRGIPKLPDKRTTDDEGNKRHGDAGVAILLADYASRREVTIMEFQALGRIRTSFDTQDYKG